MTTSTLSERIIAQHEAAHVFAAWKCRIPVVSVTIIPTETNLGGTTIGLAPQTRWEQSFIATAGCVAQGQFELNREREAGTADEEEDEHTWLDYVNGAFLFHGETDMVKDSRGMDFGSSEENLFEVWVTVEDNWEAISALAEELAKHKTLTGPEAFMILDENNRFTSPHHRHY